MVFDPTLGDMVLILLILFVAFFGVGAVLGFVVAVYFRARRDGKAPGPRPGRIGLYLSEALVGGALNFLVASLLSGATF